MTNEELLRILEYVKQQAIEKRKNNSGHMDTKGLMNWSRADATVLTISIIENIVKEDIKGDIGISYAETITYCL